MVPADKWVTDLHVDSADRIWVGFRGRGVAVRDQGVFRAVPGTGEVLPEVNDIAETPRGTLWFGTSQGLYRYQDGQFRFYDRDQGLNTDRVTNCYVDQFGHLQVTNRSVYMAANPASDAFARVPLPASGDYSSTLFQDRRGTYWIGTSGDGLIRMRASAFRMISAADGLPKGGIHSVSALDRAGDVWTGASTHGLVEIAPDGSVTRRPPSAAGGMPKPGRPWRPPTAMSGSGEREAALPFPGQRDPALPRGAERPRHLRGPVGRHLAEPARRGRSPVRARGHGQHDGRAGPAGGRRLRFCRRCAGRPLHRLFQENGIIKLQDGAKTLYNTGNGLPEDQVRSIYADRDGNLWVGMKRRGLAVLLGGSVGTPWYNPATLVEPFSDLITAIVEDEQGRLWLGAPKGVFWVMKKEQPRPRRGAIQPTFTWPARARGSIRAASGSGRSRPPAARRTGPSGSRPRAGCSRCSPPTSSPTPWLRWSRSRA